MWFPELIALACHFTFTHSHNTWKWQSTTTIAMHAKRDRDIHSPGHWTTYILPSTPELMSMMPADTGKINGTIEPHAAGWSSTYRTIECRIKEAVVALIVLGCPLIPLYGRAVPTCSGPQRSLGSTETSTGNSWICQRADTLWGRLASISTKTPPDSWRRWPWNLNPPMVKRTVITGLGYITLHTWQQYSRRQSFTLCRNLPGLPQEQTGHYNYA